MRTMAKIKSIAFLTLLCSCSIKHTAKNETGDSIRNASDTAVLAAAESGNNLGIVSESHGRIKKVRSIEVLKLKTDFFDTIELQKDSLEMGTFQKVIFKKSNNLVFEISSVDGYDSIERSIKGDHKNLVNSELILINELMDKYFINLFGFQYGCCPRTLTIIKVDKTGFSKIFDAEFDLRKIYSFSNGDIGYLGSSTFSQGLSTIDSLSTMLGSYSPSLIYRLSDDIRLDSTSSREWNMKNYVFRGYKYDQDIIVATPWGYGKYPKREFKPYVFKEKNATFPR